mmetsp:Transcript_66787/g.118218  ORF Transcript_66787/g.118218 Transcript_66787/m.118218 type:complete len:239 (+) Transcript_66787:4178-4894(+)
MALMALSSPFLMLALSVVSGTISCESSGTGGNVFGGSKDGSFRKGPMVCRMSPAVFSKSSFCSSSSSGSAGSSSASSSSSSGTSSPASSSSLRRLAFSACFIFKVVSRHTGTLSLSIDRTTTRRGRQLANGFGTMGGGGGGASSLTSASSTGAASAAASSAGGASSGGASSAGASPSSPSAGGGFGGSGSGFSAGSVTSSARSSSQRTSVEAESSLTFSANWATSCASSGLMVGKSSM